MIFLVDYFIKWYWKELKHRNMIYNQLCLGLLTTPIYRIIYLRYISIFVDNIQTAANRFTLLTKDHERLRMRIRSHYGQGFGFLSNGHWLVIKRPDWSSVVNSPDDLIYQRWSSSPVLSPFLPSFLFKIHSSLMRSVFSRFFIILIVVKYIKWNVLPGRKFLFIVKP